MAKIDLPSPDSPRNWPEDYAGHVSGYLCRCCECGETFAGDKRRVVCRLCTAAPAAQQEGE